MRKAHLWMSTAILSICSLGWLFSSCSNDDNIGPSPAQKSIVIIFENDVHCAIDGYKRIAGLRDAIGRSDTAWAAAVSCGDYLQGGSPGALSKGGYIATIMNTVGYDAVTLGNHEFDYGTPRMMELMPKINTNVVCANFYETATDKPVFAPYALKRYGEKTIGFVGATTPDAMTKKYAFFDADDTQRYDMHPNDIYQLVQEAVDEVRSKGEDILAMLTQCTARLPAEIGQFPHVSGLRYTIHSQSHTISDVTVFDATTSTWQPLDPERLYIIATLDYYSGGGFNDVLKDSRLIEQTTTVMCDCIAEYLEKTLKGVVTIDYAQSQGRITIVDD